MAAAAARVIVHCESGSGQRKAGAARASACGAAAGATALQSL